MNRAAESEDRAVQHRAQYLKRTTDLREPEALALAYRERGYASGAIARQLDTNEGTVDTYLSRVVAQYGLRAIATKPENERGDLQELSTEDIRGLAEGKDAHGGASEREQWLAHARDHPECVPAGLLEVASDNGGGGRV